MIANANAMFVFASVFKGHDFSTKPCLSKGVQTKNPPIFMVPPSRGLKISEGWFGRTRSLMHHKTIASHNIVIPDPLIHIQFIYYSSPCLGRLKFSHASAEPQHSVEMISSRNSKSHKLTATTYLQFTFISFFRTFCRLLCPSPWLAALVLHLQ